MLQAYYKIKQRLGQILLPIVVVFFSDAARANIDVIGQPDEIPTQHMVMAGMPGGHSIIQTGGGSQAKKSAQKEVGKKVLGDDTKATQGHTDTQAVDASVKHKIKSDQLAKKRAQSQRALNNWACDTATALFSYSHIHFERDKYHIQRVCDTQTWEKVEDTLFGESAYLESISRDKIDSKAFLAGPPEFVRVEKKAHGQIVWIKVPVLLMQYFSGEPQKDFLQVYLGVGNDSESNRFVLEGFNVKKVAPYT